MLHEENTLLMDKLKSECEKCSGLCCTALFFSKIDGFPKDKIAGIPCVNLLENYQCKIHSQLNQKKMKGCIGYDCFGAGQQVTQVVYKGKTWDAFPKQKSEIFDVFLKVYYLHQIRYFLIDSLLNISDVIIKEKIVKLLDENIEICDESPHRLMAFDVEEHRNKVNTVLKQVCALIQQMYNSENNHCPDDYFGKSFIKKNLSGFDLSSKLLIAADFTDCIFRGTIFLGADTRDANFNNADLSGAIFLTQGQINSSKGNSNTKIPSHLFYPPTWM
jgi:uncharacterized protein YjbI with pentapeptide repeats